MPRRQPNAVARDLDAFDLKRRVVGVAIGDEQGDVELAVDQQVLKVAAVVLDDFDRDGGKGAAVAGEDLGKHVAGHQRRHAQRQPTGGGRLVAAQGPSRLGDVGEDLARQTQKLPAFQGQSMPCALRLNSGKPRSASSSRIASATVDCEMARACAARATAPFSAAATKYWI